MTSLPIPASPRRPAAARWFAPLLLLLAACSAVQPAPAQSVRGFGAGVDVRPDAKLADIGLPLYPGAQPHRDKGDDSAGATVGLWGGSLGLRVIAIKFASPDRLETVAAFYADAMRRYGNVLDCSQPRRDAPDSDDKKTLSCSGDKPDAGGRLYKVGSKADQRMVSLKPGADGGVRFDIVRIEFKGE